MKKALIEIEEKIKLVDVVIEIIDARAPLSSINPQFEERIKNKKKLLVISKSDLADPEETKKWQIYFKNKVNSLLILNLTDAKAQKIISDEVLKLGEEKHQKEKAKGMKPQPIKAMIIGVPNVGKSSLINRIAKRNAAGVQNKPGFTRGEQYIKVNKDFILLDTPGILPTNYDDKEHAINLALLGSIREEILPNDQLVRHLLKYLNKNYPNALVERFDISDLSDPIQVSEQVARKRGLITGGEYDIERAYFLILKEFKEGKLGRITLEKAL
jgi:ribosome biogenesis GTPase A